MFGNRSTLSLVRLATTCALVSLIGLAGCGGGGGGGSFTGTAGTDVGAGSGGSGSGASLGRYVPNYATDTDSQTGKTNRLLHWNQFPVRVYFTNNAYLTPDRKALAVKGFDWWIRSMDNAISYQVVDNAGDANVSVQFEPRGATSYTGVTNYNYSSDGALVSADVTLNLSYLANPASIPATAAPEFAR